MMQLEDDFLRRAVAELRDLELSELVNTDRTDQR